MAEEQKQQDVGQFETNERQKGINDGIATMVYVFNQILYKEQRKQRRASSALDPTDILIKFSKVANEFTTVNVNTDNVNDESNESDRNRVDQIINTKLKYQN